MKDQKRMAHSDYQKQNQKASGLKKPYRSEEKPEQREEDK